MKNRVLLVLSFFYLQSCTSIMVINKAGHNEFFPPFESCDTGSSWWYMALPLTIPFDVITVLGISFIAHSPQLIMPTPSLGDSSEKCGSDASDQENNDHYFSDHYSLTNPVRKYQKNKSNITDPTLERWRKKTNDATN